jgi:cell division protease FtsH
MSDKLGPLHFGKPQGEVFLGRDFNDSSKDYSEQTAVEIDGEVKTIVTANYDRARKIVVDNLDKLKALAEALLEYETVDGAEIDSIFQGRRLDRKPPLPSASARAAAAKAAADKAAPRPSIFSPPRPLPDPEKA